MFKMKAEDGTNNISGRNILRLRSERGISQRGLARTMQIEGYDIDHYAIRRIENGERFVTDVELVAFASIFQVSLEELVRI